MGAPMKHISFLVLLMIFIGPDGKRGVHGAGDHQCGKSSIDNEVTKLAPCTLAAHDEKAEVSDKCCTVVKNVDVSCLCAILLSDIAKSSRINPVVAVTIPKRCNIANRAVGYKCGGMLAYSLVQFVHFNSCSSL
jgi:hypothetical protein